MFQFVFLFFFKKGLFRNYAKILFTRRLKSDLQKKLSIKANSSSFFPPVLAKKKPSENEKNMFKAFDIFMETKVFCLFFLFRSSDRKIYFAVMTVGKAGLGLGIIGNFKAM